MGDFSDILLEILGRINGGIADPTLAFAADKLFSKCFLLNFRIEI